ncbi:MAG: hypothetical protein N4A65_08115 [Cohaesibacter sp.]|jgi:hypothetical protein|nr:hypothetical protein [Cohaesibacter sp.]
MAALITVNLAFAIALAFMIGYGVTSNPIWLVFLVVWCVAEALLARNNSIGWKSWLFLLLALTCLDFAIVAYLR